MRRRPANSLDSSWRVGAKILQLVSAYSAAHQRLHSNAYRKRRWPWTIKIGHRNNSVGNPLRPQVLSEFIGQTQVHANLGVFIQAARARSEPLDHVLLIGPPGVGKTTLAQIVARELDVNCRLTSGPVGAKPGALATLLGELKNRDVLFIDEIHRLGAGVEEILYSAMEDFRLDRIVGQGRTMHAASTAVAPFTLIGATTRAGLLSSPLRDRFGITLRLDFYTEVELEQIVSRGCQVLGIPMTSDGANEVARRARGTPRIATRLLQRVRDFALVMDIDTIDRPVVCSTLAALDIDVAGLDAMDRRYLAAIALDYGGGPVGLDALAVILSESREAIEDIIEPFLIQQRFVQRTPRGRILTTRGCNHIGLQHSGDKRALDDSEYGAGVSTRKNTPVH